jgi:hypothetical protein
MNGKFCYGIIIFPARNLPVHRDVENNRNSDSVMRARWREEYFLKIRKVYSVSVLPHKIWVYE